MEPGAHGSHDQDEPPKPESPDDVRRLAAQVEMLQSRLTQLQGQPIVSLGAPIPPRRSRLGAVLALILVTGLVIAGALYAASYLLRAQSSAKPPQVNVAIVLPSPATNDVLIPPATATSMPTQTPMPTNTSVDTATPADTATPVDTATPEDTATAAPNEGVSVCTDSHYDKHDVLCMQSDSTITQDEYFNARYVLTGPQGGHFAHNNLLIILSKANGDGSWDQLGTVADTVPIADTSQSNVVSWVFDSTNTVPTFDGSTYQIEADSGDTSLGAATFTLTDGTSASIPPTDIPTDTAAPQDTVTAAPVAGVYDPSDACAGATSPTDAVIRFYRALALQRYSAAYQCFDAAWQVRSSYSDWVKGYATTLSSRLVLANSLPGNRVWIDIHSVDPNGAHLLARSFTGSWQLDANLRLHSAHISELRHDSVDSVPPTNHADLFAFDSRQVLTHLRADVTNHGVADDIFVTKDTGCSGCSTRHVWVYSDEMVVFSQSFPAGVSDVQPASDGSGFSITTPDGTRIWTWTPSGFTLAPS